MFLIGCLCNCTLSPIDKGESCLAIGDYRNAVAFFEKAIADRPDAFRARRGLALARLQQCSAHEAAANPVEWQEAVEALHYARRLRETPELSEQEAVADFKLAKALEAQGDTVQALQSALKAVALKPRDAPMINYAAVLSYHTGNINAAINLFVQATVVDSADAVAFFDIGMLHWYSKDAVKAYEWWLKALRRSPRDTTVQYWVAKAELELKKMAGRK